MAAPTWRPGPPLPAAGVAACASRHFQGVQQGLFQGQALPRLLQGFAFQDEHVFGALAEGIDARGAHAGAVPGEDAGDLGEQAGPRRR